MTTPAASNRIHSALIWLGLVQSTAAGDRRGHPRDHGHAYGASGGHGHTHGVVDPTITTSARGIWAIKWSFVILAITAALQLAVVLVSGSVALLADTIHNIGDAATAIPLWIAFALALRKPSARFTYGLGRVEDLAGAVVVFIILFSALVAGYEAVDRFIHPQSIRFLLWVAIAGIVGFVGNEAVAVFRIRVGREIDSAALIADGYHARTDGLTSLAVVIGAAGVWAGFPLADPIIGMLITIAIFGIVWQSAKAVFTRTLDGVEPGVIAEIRHAAEHVPSIRRVLDVRARWLGHRLHAELDVAIDGAATVADADALIGTFEQQLISHVPALAVARIRVRPHHHAVRQDDRVERHEHAAGHRHAPAPALVQGELAGGTLEIIDTPAGERLRFTVSHGSVPLREVSVAISRGTGRPEILVLLPVPGDGTKFLSAEAPAEPHEFSRNALPRASMADRKPFLSRCMSRSPHDHGHRSPASA